MEIWKFPFDIMDTVKIRMPANAKILCAQVQINTPCIWAIVEPKNREGFEIRSFKVFGTGFEMQYNIDALNYIGTVQLDTLVFHIFEYNATKS